MPFPSLPNSPLAPRYAILHFTYFFPVTAVVGGEQLASFRRPGTLRFIADSINHQNIRPIKNVDLGQLFELVPDPERSNWP